MGPVCTPGNVTVPCEARMWDLGIQALYLQSVYGTDKAYALDSAGRFKSINSDWSLGFRAEGSYHFNTGNDATIDWTHFSSDSDGFRFAAAALKPYTNQNRLDQVNVVMGQHVDVSLVKKMRFYGGLQYANIESQIETFDIPPTILAQQNNASFRGLGPVVGIDYAYLVTQALSVTANASSSILYGTSRYYSGFSSDTLHINVNTLGGSRKALVASFAAKLGLNYAYTMANGVLNLEGGYQAMDYLDALQAQTVSSATGLSTGSIKDTNYGLYGPYLGIKYCGNV